MEAAADEERPFLLHHQPTQDEGSASEYTSDGTVDVRNEPALKRSTGNWRACFTILSAELAECLAFFAIGKNLVTYLTGELRESNASAARNVSTWVGTCFFTPIVGAFFADTYWGRYHTVVVFLSIYALGMLILTASASLPFFLEDSSGGIGARRVAAYLGLYLAALGTGGIKPCSSALGADQFDAADPAERVTKASFFNWYYFAINIGSLLSGTLLVWVQDNVGWGIGFAAPAALMLTGLAVFVSGRKVYRYKPLQGSPLKSVCQVLVAAVRNYRLELPEGDDYVYSSALLLHHGKQPSSATCTGDFRFLDRAAIVVTTGTGKQEQPGPWQLCTVSQVEELKMLLRMMPVWASMVVFFAVTAQMSSTFIEQGGAMDNRVGAFTVPAASLATFDVVAVMVCIPVYDAVLVPLARRATGQHRGISQLQRIGVGLALAVAGMVYAALVEARRLALVRAGAPPLNIMWQAPSFAVLGAAEVFASIGMLEFYYDQSPEGMKSLGSAIAYVAIAAGNYLNSFLLTAVAQTTARSGKPGWIPDDLDKGHLDYFFWMMAALGVANLVHFLHVSIRYRGNTSATM